MVDSRGIVAAVCALVLGVTLLGHAVRLLANEDTDGPFVTVHAVRVSSVPLPPRIEATGTVVSTLDTAISAELAGRLISIAEVGHHARKGEVLATIDDDMLQLQKRQNEATVRRIEANLLYMDQQQARLSSLALKNNTAQSDLDQLRSQRDMIAQDLVSAEVALARTEHDIRSSRVVAPFDGVVAERMQSPGGYTKVGDALLRLVNTSALEASVQAPLRVTRFNKAGDLVSLECEFGKSKGPVRSIVPVGDSQSRTVELRISLPPGLWTIGEWVKVRLANGSNQTTLTVPRVALVQLDGEAHVFRIDDGNVVRRVTVKAGDAVGENVEVFGALHADDLIVVDGADRLQDAQRVQVVERNPLSV